MSSKEHQLTEAQWRLHVAMSSYKFPGGLFGEKEFKDDYNRLNHLCKLLKVNRNERKIGSRVLLNYITISINQFGESFFPLFLSKADPTIYPCFISCLKFMNIMPTEPVIVYNRLIDLDNITPDPILFDRLMAECR